MDRNGGHANSHSPNLFIDGDFFSHSGGRREQFGIVLRVQGSSN